ncbi:MAG: 50S ribosomal protein L40e [Candidatus Aenigmatarchaeota archaeon]|nr:MAG: 50S ribosomal protein L40e [Candidatus Aenigmarchaeota archaeon]
MPKGKFKEAEDRLFHRVYVCMNCGAKLRTDSMKVRHKKAKCRKCKHKDLRPMRKRK